MSQTLEITKVDNVTEEERKRIEYNSRIKENYRKMMTMDCSELKNGGLEERTYSYPSLDSYKPLLARREITFEDVLIPEEVKKETQQRPQAQATQRAYSSNIDFSSTIYTSSAYREAALRKERAASAVAETTDETLCMPTSTTLQYGTRPLMQTSTAPVAAPTAKTGVATANSTEVAASQDMRAYYTSLAKKVAVAFAVAVVVMMVVIAINSAVLGGIDLQIMNLQQELSALQAQAQSLQQAIANETSWESILEFIQQSGMIQAV